LPEPIARLRLNLDFMPSPSEEHPGLFIRDPYRYSDAMLIIPPVLVECLQCFDGQHTDLDLRQALVRATGDLNVSDIQQHLVATLSASGFLEDENFARLKDERQREFAASPVREPAHAGSAYPAEVGELRATMERYLGPQDGAAPAPSQKKLFAVAAPHVSPEGGWQSYRSAYHLLGEEHRERTFVILATSHYGEPEKFGLTRKRFVTPLGETTTDERLVDWLAERGGDAIEMEDYCHSFEHTVELQLIFLQHRLGPNVKILPILCGAFASSLYQGGEPESDDGVRRFFDALGELGDREGDRLFWILGVDMAHMGARYQDRFSAVADQGAMAEVATRDRQRIACINSGDAAGFWSLVQENRDDLKWCGSAPFYTFLKSAPGARGELMRYEQWNIDEKSVVSFAGMAFSRD
jgi:AmmeMemoRadiSam system protein B